MFTLILFYFLTIWHVTLCQQSNGINSTQANNLSNSTSSIASNLSLYGIHENKTRLNQFWKSIHRIEANADSRFIQIADQINQLSHDLNQSSNECYNLIEQAFRIGLHEKWSATMISSNALLASSSTFINGLISNRFTSLGDFFSCFKLKEVNVENSKQISFVGKYCLASLNTPQLDYYSKEIEQERFSNLTDYFDLLTSDWLTVRNRFPRSFGICAPSICDEHDLRLLIQNYFDQYLEGIDLDVGYCQIDEPKKFNFGFLLSLFILLFMVTVSILANIIFKFTRFLKVSSSKVYPESTAPTLQTKLNLKFVAQVINCFNFERNCKALFSVSDEHKHRHTYDLRFIHGFKAFLILSVVFAHSNIFLTIILFSKMPIFERYPTYFHDFQSKIGVLNNFMLRAYLVVDYFFAISGFLVTYLTLNKVKKSPNFLSYVFLRWLNLVPSVVAIICLTIVLQKLGMGPLFHEELTEPYVKPCYDYWWTHVLFINNYWTLDKMCGPNLWFIAADFQLHIILYFVLVLYFRKKLFAWLSSIGIIIAVVALFIGSNLTGIGPGLAKLDYSFNFQYPAPLNAIRFNYTAFHTHTLAYFFGVLIAIKLISRKKPIAASNIKDSLIIFFGTMYIALMVIPIKAIETDQNENKNLSYLIPYMIFYILTVLVEGFCIYYLIISKKSLVKRLLSAKFLIPIGRLSYGIYLLNPLMNWYSIQMNWSTPPLTFIYTFTNSMATYFSCLLLSIFLYVFFQTPFHNLTQLFVRWTLHEQPINNNPPMEFVKSQDSNTAWVTTANSKEEQTQLRSVINVN